jgi:hypothetical protein
MKNVLIFGALALCLNSFGQSKKEQIAALNYSMDSLNVILSTTRNKAAKDIGELNTTIEDLNQEIAQLKSEVISLKLDLAEMSTTNVELEAKLKNNSSETLMSQFVSGFYDNIELSIEENQRAYETGSPFPSKNYSIYLSSRARIPQERLKELTGAYHYMFNIGSSEVISVLKNKKLYEVRVKVNYWRYEVGELINEEVITVELEKGIPKITGWYDVKIKMDDGGLDEYEGLNYSDTEQTNLYQLIGGSNRRRVDYIKLD